MGISKNMLQFLEELSLHNETDWFHANRDRYDDVRKEMIIFVGAFIERMSKFDPYIKNADAKKSLFRINRDIRFSKDKSPYKVNFGADVVREGRKSLFSGYYIHIQPGNYSFVAGWLYYPPSEVLAVVRKKLAKDYKAFERIIAKPEFKKLFDRPLGRSLKTAPEWFAKNIPGIERIRMQDRYVHHQIKDSQLGKADLLDKVVQIAKATIEYNNFFNKAIEELVEDE